jgi:hypothetical protein
MVFGASLFGFGEWQIKIAFDAGFWLGATLSSGACP